MSSAVGAGGQNWRLKMMGTMGGYELLIVFVIVLLLFGIGRIGKIGHELGTGIRAFKQGLQSPESDAREQVE